MTLAPNDRRHGTPNGYTNYRCRCDACREAWRVYYAEQVARARAERTCPNCGGPGGLARDGTCGTCYSYRQTHGTDRPASLFRTPSTDQKDDR